jgi:hypothetical protein
MISATRLPLEDERGGRAVLAQRVELDRALDGADRQADVEHVVVGLVGRAVEDGGRAACPLHERVAVPGRDGRGGGGQQRGERAEGQVHVVRGEQGLVVGVHLGGGAVVVDDLERDLAAEDAAVRVDVAGPQLVAALEGLAVRGKVAGQRERRADHDGRLAGRARAGHRSAGAAAAGTAAGRQDAGRKQCCRAQREAVRAEQAGLMSGASFLLVGFTSDQVSLGSRPSETSACSLRSSRPAESASCRSRAAKSASP